MGNCKHIVILLTFQLQLKDRLSRCLSPPFSGIGVIINEKGFHRSLFVLRFVINTGQNRSFRFDPAGDQFLP